LTIETASEIDPPAIPRGRSGPASVVLGAFAAVLVLAGIASGVGGLHWLLIAPLVLLINLIAGVLAVIAVVRPIERKWGVAGLAINAAPLLLLIGGVLFGPSLPVYTLVFNPSPPLHTLPSGKQIRVKFAGTVHFSGGPPAFVMECDTDIPMEKRAELRKEVDEIWEIFKNNAEAAHLTSAVIRMNHNEGTGIITRGNGFGFAYEKQADGKWQCMNDK
jgi:hypothetical protein